MKTQLMKPHPDLKKSEALSWSRAVLFLLATAAGLHAIPRRAEAANVVIWDTASPFADTLDLADKSGWKPVPADLLTLEAAPPKASSDPGFYGREYSFKGDAVVENRSVLAVFWSAKGRVVLFSKADAIQSAGGSLQLTGLPRKVVEFVPSQGKTQTPRISRIEIVRNAGDQLALKAEFSAKGLPDFSAVFAFDKTEIVEIQPGQNMKEVSLLSSIEYGVVPSFIGDDLIFGASDYPSANALCLPSENLFLGLLSGENDILVLTWPKGKQQVQLKLGQGQPGKHAIQSIEFENDGQSFYLAALGARGIWHREELAPAYLEKDVALKWRRPFSAKWKTLLSEVDVKTTFAFRESKGQVWRGVPGSYTYPAWFQGDDAFFHLSKKVPPKGESLIYFLEGQDTPPSVSTPVDILKATLGRAASDSILDMTGRKLRTHHRRCDGQVHRACTCGYTEAIQAVFESGEEAKKKEFVAEALDDMIYFVRRHVERIDEYRQFADGMSKFLRTKETSSPDLKPFLESMEAVVQQIPQEYDVQRENMKSLAHADELARQTMVLTHKKGPDNLKAYMDLLKAWRAMGGAQDYVVAQCHTITRKLFQEAGYGCVHQPKAVEVAEEIMTRCRQVLRNPDGYEIWAEY